METKVKFNDNRKSTHPTFEDIVVGSMFTEVDGEIIYIKIDKAQIHYYNEDIIDDEINAIDIRDGEFVSFDDDEEIHPIQEIEITIKK